MQHFPTTRAAEAIIAQITGRGDCEGTFYAEVDGKECEFTAWFTTEWEREDCYSDTHGRSWGHYDNATCTLIGAWTFDDEDAVMFAGNRSELAALIGEAKVSKWEANQAEIEMENAA